MDALFGAPSPQLLLGDKGKRGESGARQTIRAMMLALGSPPPPPLSLGREFACSWLARGNIKTMTNPSDPLDTFIAAAAAALDLPLEPDWAPSVKANLAVTLTHAATVAEFTLPDAAEPAPVFKA
jgi:hypothetical protein